MVFVTQMRIFLSVRRRVFRNYCLFSRFFTKNLGVNFLSDYLKSFCGTRLSDETSLYCLHGLHGLHGLHTLHSLHGKETVLG